MNRSVAFGLTAILGLAAIGWLTYPALTIVIGVVLAVLIGVSLTMRRTHAGSTALVNRWTSRSRKHHGVASTWTILRVSSGWAMRRKATVLRPHLTGVTRTQRWRTPITEFATPLMRVGWLRVFSPVEDVTVAFGGPRTGKSGELGCRILDAPGAVIATSTRTDLITNTIHGREKKGPVYVFNPSGVGGMKSTIAFNPLTGCEDPTVATARAIDLLSATGRLSGGEGYWLDLARLALAPLLHAAALGEGSMWNVRSWVADPELAEPPVMRLLRRSTQRVFDQDAHQFFTMGDRTRASICATIMPALSWLTEPAAEAATRGTGFDVPALLADKATVYLLGAEDAQVAPLVAALTGHIAREARRVAGLHPKGRLNPPLTLALDEAALICPIPLDKWTADMGGRNITIHIRAQSRAQLRQRWGDVGASAILNNAATLLMFGGTRDIDDLSMFSALTGERHDGGRQVPVLTPSQIAQLPHGHAVLVRRGMPPVIGKPLMVWRRHRVRRHAEHAVGALARAAGNCRARWVPRKAPMFSEPIATLPAGSSVKAEWKPGITTAGGSRGETRS
jgi:type IV secretion system protein VirD4